MPTASDPHSPSTPDIKSPSNTAGSKRKREISDDNPAGHTLTNGHTDGAHAEQLHQLFKDVLVLLKDYDTKPSILNHAIPPSTSETPSAKRQKLPSPHAEPTITTLVDSNAYGCIEDLSADIDAVISMVTSEPEIKDTDDRVSVGTRFRSEHRAIISEAAGFKRRFDKLVSQELVSRPYLANSHKIEEPASDVKAEEDSKLDIKVLPESEEDETRYNTVLTLFGGSGQPKQLFSTLKEADEHQGSGQSRSKKIEGIGLPNGISFTKVIPVHSEGGTDTKKETPTIGKLFAPPPNVLPLNPPRQSRHTATRSSSVNWYNPAEATTPSRPSRKENYTTQPLTTGQWLTYNIVPSTRELSSQESKRKQRDRALSFGETQAEPSQQTLTLHRQAKEDALLRSVYSGFAPDRDSVSAMVPERSKGRQWWKRVGEKRHHTSAQWPISRSIYSASDQEFVDEAAMETDAEEMSLAEAVESWEPEEMPPEMRENEAVTDDSEKGVDEILKEVSELLETLNSYQDVRNSSLANNARPSATQNPQLAAMTGTPSSPSSHELDLYNILKSQLSIIVSSLPPFALAKLDGEKLGALNINTKIQMEMKSYHGSLEEDEISTRGRQPAVSATSTYPSRTSNAAVGIAPRNNYLSASSTPVASSHRPSQVPQTMPARSTLPASYLQNQQQYPSRAPSGNQYINNMRASYSNQRPVSSTPDRYPYSAAQQYGQQLPRQSYGSNYNSYAHQNGTSYGQSYANSQQASGNARMSLPQYQHASRPTNAYNSASTPVSMGGNASPSYGYGQYSSQGYALPDGTPSRPRPQPYQSHPSQYSSQPSASPQTNGAQMNGTSNVDASNKPPLPDAPRASSNTPQPAVMKQAEQGQQNGVSATQQSGSVGTQAT
ncbi:MAG: hypothetical protein Q9174_004417 [Haloplaca sp. 1 TL-2023]